MKEIILNTGHLVEISDEDINFISNINFRIIKGNYFIVTSPIKYRDNYLHRLIAERAGLNCSNMIDHEDRNKFNNQRNNLRAATRSQNGMNRKATINNTSGYKGVYFNSWHNKWEASITVNQTAIYLGRYDKIEDAAKAYNKAAEQSFGEFANLNEI